MTFFLKILSSLTIRRSSRHWASCAACDALISSRRARLSCSSSCCRWRHCTSSSCRTLASSILDLSCLPRSFSADCSCAISAFWLAIAEVILSSVERAWESCMRSWAKEKKKTMHMTTQVVNNRSKTKPERETDIREVLQYAITYQNTCVICRQALRQVFVLQPFAALWLDVKPENSGCRLAPSSTQGNMCASDRRVTKSKRWVSRLTTKRLRWEKKIGYVERPWQGSSLHGLRTKIT